VIEFCSLDLFGAHVPGSTERGSGLREVHAGGGWLVQLCQSEVCDLGRGLTIEQDVFRLDVSVHDAGFCGRGQGCCHLLQPFDSCGKVRGAVTADPLAEIQPRNILLHDVRDVVFVTGSDDLYDVGMTESSGGPCFLFKSFQEDIAASLQGVVFQDFDGDLSAKAGLFREVDVCHASAAQSAQQQEFTDPQVAEICLVPAVLL
jgi:hypothetical protein